MSAAPGVVAGGPQATLPPESERPLWVVEQLAEGGDFPATVAFGERRLRLETGLPFPVFVSPEFRFDVVSPLARILEGSPARLVERVDSIAIPGIPHPRGWQVAGTCNERGMIVLWGKPTPRSIGRALTSSVIHHELAHCLVPSCGAPDRSAWKTAQRADAAVDRRGWIARSLGLRVRPIRARVGSLKRLIHLEGEWITDYAASTAWRREDWAESVMLHLCDREHGRLFGEKRFADVFPHRARLIAEWVD